VTDISETLLTSAFGHTKTSSVALEVWSSGVWEVKGEDLLATGEYIPRPAVVQRLDELWAVGTGDSSSNG